MYLFLWYNMKRKLSTYNFNKEFNIEQWLEENKPIGYNYTTDKSWKSNAYEIYIQLIEEFKEFLNCSEPITNSNGNILKPIEIYNTIEDYKLRILKLLMIINLKLYKTYNVNKDTKIRYVVMRAFWLDSNGKKFRNFSKNLGAENKIAINGKIPKHLIDSVEDDMAYSMYNLYLYEYSDIMSAFEDEDGNIVVEPN